MPGGQAPGSGGLPRGEDAVNLESKVSLLGCLPLFEDFGPDQLRLVAFNCSTRKYGDRQMLHREGDAARSALIVYSGQIAVTRQRGKKIVDDGQIGPGGVLGEMALLVPTERASDARAMGDCEILEVPRAVFHRVLDEYPEIAQSLHGRLSGRFGAFLGDLQKVKSRFGALEEDGGGR